MKFDQRAALFLLAACLAGTAGAEPLKVFVTATGDDRQDGRSERTAVATVQRALDLGIKQASASTTQIVVAIDGGTYTGQTVTTAAHPRSIPIVITTAERGVERPVFDGGGKGGTWFTLKSARGVPTRVTISGLTIRNYATAITLNGNRNDPRNGWNGGNVIRNNFFRNIGSIANPSGPGSTAALRLVNSRKNHIENNQFITIRNVAKCGMLHAIYLAHNATGNVIVNNRFEDGCGPTIKFRDASNDNVVENNTFLDQVTTSAVLEAFCNKDTREDCTKAEAECPSWNNAYHGNKITFAKARASAKFKPVEVMGPDDVGGCPAPRSGRRVVEAVR